MTIASSRVHAATSEFATVMDFFQSYMASLERGEVMSDFTFGNPQEMPLPGLVNALRKTIEPRSTDWFAYKTSEAEPRAVIASALSIELNLPFEPDDIALTQGAFGAMSVAFTMLTDPGDEVLIPLPGWFCYASMLATRNVTAVKTPLAAGTFDLDLDEIERAISPRTRIVVVNTPHNPTGRIYSEASLKDLAGLLERKSVQIGRRIYTLSDEPYRRIRFGGAGFTSPASVYPWTLIDYSYAKIMLSPGLRIGYLALSPNLPAAERAKLRGLLFPTQMALGWAFPDAPLQYAISDLETVSLDMTRLQAKRDRMLGALRQWGYEMTEPEGTFYLWGKVPGGDSQAFASAMAEHQVRIMPGTLFERPAHFRICLTASEEMIENALPVFQELAGFTPQ